MSEAHACAQNTSLGSIMTSPWLCVGDSRALLCREQEAIALSLDHKATRSDEVVSAQHVDGSAGALGEIQSRPHLDDMPVLSCRSHVWSRRAAMCGGTGSWASWRSVEPSGTTACGLSSLRSRRWVTTVCRHLFRLLGIRWW